jgi:hypothetical protein
MTTRHFIRALSQTAGSAASGAALVIGGLLLLSAP